MKVKRFLLLFLCAVMLFSMVACSGETTSKSAESADASASSTASTEPSSADASEAQSNTGYSQGQIVSTEPTGIVSSKDSMIVVVPADPGSLDPHDSVTQNKHQSTRQIYETLVVYDDDGNLIPWLAESWEYADDCTINFKIRGGKFGHVGHMESGMISTGETVSHVVRQSQFTIESRGIQFITDLLDNRQTFPLANKQLK